MIYLDLESLIKKTKLTEKQRYIINVLMRGYTEKDISELMLWDLSSVNSIFDTACNKIKEQNDLEWINWTETSGSVKTKYNYKQCSKCGDFLRATNEYFAPDKTGKYGLRSICRSCRKSVQKTL